jgi:hypothetical protein
MGDLEFYHEILEQTQITQVLSLQAEKDGPNF